MKKQFTIIAVIGLAIFVLYLVNQHFAKVNTAAKIISDPDMTAELAKKAAGTGKSFGEVLNKTADSIVENTK